MLPNLADILTFVVVVAVICLVIVPPLMLRSDKSSSFGAAFVASAPLVPMAGSVAIVLAYLFLPKLPLDVDWPLRDYPVTVGSISVLVLWVVIAWIYKGFTSVDRANASSYGELRQRLAKLNAKLVALAPPAKEKNDSSDIPYQEALSHSRDIARKLGLDMTEAPYHESKEDQADDASQNKKQKKHKANDSLNWVMATGYIDLWGRMYRAEEAMYEAKEIKSPAVIRWAVHDDLRLAGSTIEKKDDLRIKLREAVGVIDPGALRYLSPPGGRNSSSDTANKDANGTKQISEDERNRDIAQARAILHEVRYNVNDFRAKRWAGLVRARNHLLASITFTGLTMYIVLALVVMNDTPPGAVMAASVFFLVGALVGLFKRLRDEATGGAIQDDDYGLARTRLIHTPLFSGLAAVGGVVLLAMAPAVLSNAIPPPQGKATATPTALITATAIPNRTPTALLTDGNAGGAIPPTATSLASRLTAIPTSAVATGTAGPTNTAVIGASSTTVQSGTGSSVTQVKALPLLEDIFNLERNPFGLIIAAIFGLAPVLLIDTLQKQVDEYRRDLKSTEAPQSSEG